MNERLRCYERLLRLVPLPDLIRLYWEKLLLLALGCRGHAITWLRVRGLPTKIGVRNQGSDFQVFKQIFGRQEYSIVGDLGDVDTVIDCGANVGLASLFFWLRYQPRRIIAVEPDPDNAALCRTNLEGLGPSVQVIQAAVWPIPADLAISRGVFRDGSDWTVTVRLALKDGTGNVRGMTMDELIEFAEPGRVDLLKMDIEGSECGVLSASARKWLGRVHNMVIELHDDNCSAAFETALADYRYKMLRAGDLVVARNILPRLPAVRGGVSIVIPAFNAEDFLEAAVESVIAQIPTEWDLTIVNDGSVDSTPSLADALATRDSRIRVIHQPNRGLALSRNYGLAASDPAHEFVLFLDADDQLQPGAFDALLKLAHEHPESAACHGAARRVDASGRPLESSGNGATRMALTGRRAMPAGEDGPTTRQMLVVQNCILSAGSVLVRKDALDRIGAFDAAISETSDHDLWYRLSDLGPLEFTPQVVLSYQVREASMSSHHRLMRRSSLSMRRRWFRQASGIARTTVVLGYREYLRLLARGQRALIRNLIAQRRFLRVFLEIPRVAYRTIKTMPVIPSLILRAGRAFNPD